MAHSGAGPAGSFAQVWMHRPSCWRRKSEFRLFCAGHRGAGLKTEQVLGGPLRTRRGRGGGAAVRGTRRFFPHLHGRARPSAHLYRTGLSLLHWGPALGTSALEKVSLADTKGRIGFSCTLEQEIYDSVHLYGVAKSLSAHLCRAIPGAVTSLLGHPVNI